MADHTSAARAIASAGDPFLREALDELRSVATDDGLHLLDGGAMLFDLPGRFDDLAARWRAEPPIFIRHVHPVDAEIELDGDATDTERVTARTSSLQDGVDPGRPFSVQARFLLRMPYSPAALAKPLTRSLADATGAAVDVRHPEQVVSVTVARVGDGLRAFLGLSDASENLSAWSGGAPVYARDPARISRSELKLLEALEVFGVELPPDGLALDLGAVPGGWSRLLRGAGVRVVAVDPGELHPMVAADPGVRHEQTTVGRFLEATDQRFDVVVNDLRMDALRSARLMQRCVDITQPDAVAIMTLKLPRKNAESTMRRAVEVLRSGWTVAGLRHLFHNGTEVTACLRKR